jgi:hypothetical protein
MGEKAEVLGEGGRMLERHVDRRQIGRLLMMSCGIAAGTHDNGKPLFGHSGKIRKCKFPLAAH